MEQLKERYYDMCRLLLTARSANPADGTDYSEHPLAKFKFDAKHERERKAEFERLYERSEAEVQDEVMRLEQARALEAKMKAQKKQAVKPGGRAAGLAALRASLSANGLGGSSDQLALTGLPSLAGLMDAPRKHRNAEVWLRSKDLSNKRPASDKLSQAFEERMRSLNMPIRPLPTEVNVNLYNQCRAHVVLLVELEAKLEKLEADRHFLLQRNAPPAPMPAAAHHGVGHHGASGGGGAGQKRALPQGGGGGGGAKRSHH